jgi:hypothetical protein
MIYPHEQSARGELPGAAAVVEGAGEVIGAAELDTGDVIGAAELLEGTVTGMAELEAVGTTGGVELALTTDDVVRLLVFAARLPCAVVLLSK